MNTKDDKTVMHKVQLSMSKKSINGGGEQRTWPKEEGQIIDAEVVSG